MFCIYSDTRDLPRLQSSTPSPSVRLPSLFDALMPSFSVAYFVVESVGVNAAAQLNSLLTQLTLLDGQNRFPLWLSFCCTLVFSGFSPVQQRGLTHSLLFYFSFRVLGLWAQYPIYLESQPSSETSLLPQNSPQKRAIATWDTGNASADGTWESYFGEGCWRWDSFGWRCSWSCVCGWIVRAIPKVDAPFQVFGRCIVAGAQLHSPHDCVQWPHVASCCTSNTQANLSRKPETQAQTMATATGISAPVFQPFSPIRIGRLCFLPYRLFRCCHNLLLLPLYMLPLLLPLHLWLLLRCCKCCRECCCRGNIRGASCTCYFDQSCGYQFT